MKIKTTTCIAGIFAISAISQSMAASIPFSTAPPGNGGKPPAPNLILTLDNSGSMAGTGMAALRDALTQAFSEENVPTDSIRLGWNTLNGGTGISIGCTTFSPTACGGNDIRPLSQTHRTNFLNWVADASWNTRFTTPTHTAYLRALQKFDIQPNNIASPWAESPNEKIGNYLACRKSYVMLMTDGSYNIGYNAAITQGGSSNLDSVNRTLPDGKIFSSRDSATLIYRDQDTPGYNTLSDLAFHYWAKDLVDKNDDNIIKPTIRITGDTLVNAGGEVNTIPEYWHPQNNPASWQHVVTYTIGFNNAANWKSQPNNTGHPPFDGRPEFPNDFNGLLSGARTWPRLFLEQGTARNTDSGNIGNRKLTEMWHVAINSRGTFYPAKTANDLVNAMRTIVQSVTTDTSQRVTSVAGSSLSSKIDSYGYYSTYDANKWSGNIHVQSYAASASATLPSPLWGSNSAASLLDAKIPASRKIFTSNSNGTTTLTAETFAWSNLSTDQQALLNGSDARGEARLAYLRGERSQEATGFFRSRNSILGDIVNSKIWFMRGKPNAGYLSADYLRFSREKGSRQNTIFVGANDGMLHAFDATNGSETFSYVPQGVYRKISEYTSPHYSHQYFVDGSPFTADFKDGSNWKTLLAGFMGAGSKGYFLLDVTNPTNMDGTTLIADTTASSDTDIGYIFQEPVTERTNPMVTRQITRMNNNEWAFITGNGYNSSNENAVLLIHFLTGPQKGSIQKIAATSTGSGNGLSAPRLVDLNGDDVPDVAYAGDLHGNLWKFNISQRNASSWGMASTSPILRARNTAGQIQPITSAPIYTPHSENGLMVVVGTGQNLTNNDRTSTNVQSYYGVRDVFFTYVNPSLGGITIPSPGAPSVLNRSELVEQTADAQVDPAGTVDDTTVWEQSNNSVNYSTKKGWYLDLPFSGERALANPRWFEGSVLDLITQVPANGSDTNAETCEATLTRAVNTLRMVDAESGGRPSSLPFGTLANGSQPTAMDLDDKPPYFRDGDESRRSECVGSNCAPNEHGAERKFSANAVVAPSWRQMQ